MKKIEIAIVEKNKYIIEKMKKVLKEFQLQNITIYEDEILYLYSDNNFDIVFLNCDILDNDFINLVNTRKQTDELFIFLSSSQLLLAEGFKFGAFRFILLSRFEKEFIEAMKSAIEYLSRLYISVIYERRNYVIKLSKVLVIYSENHYLNFVMNFTTIKVRMGFREIEEYLECNAFIRAKKGNYVNINHIVKFDKKKVSLDNGLHIELSRYGYKQLFNKYMGSFVHKCG